MGIVLCSQGELRIEGTSLAQALGHAQSREFGYLRGWDSTERHPVEPVIGTDGTGNEASTRSRSQRTASTDMGRFRA
jgi:hypothetical protein